MIQNYFPSIAAIFSGKFMNLGINSKTNMHSMFVVQNYVVGYKKISKGGNQEWISILG